MPSLRTIQEKQSRWWMWNISFSHDLRMCFVMTPLFSFRFADWGYEFCTDGTERCCEFAIWPEMLSPIGLGRCMEVLRLGGWKVFRSKREVRLPIYA